MVASRRCLFAFASIVALSGCAAGMKPQVVSVAGREVLLTGANVRAVNYSYLPGRGGSTRALTCAEPSPDIAEAINTAFNFGGSFGIGGLPGGISPEAAAALSSSRAQAVAQLGERLATIQLLRDGLYRACEAYSNGAITPTTYAIMLARYDDSMITMLLGELAAGAFGRSGANIGGKAGGEAKATSDSTTKATDFREIQGRLLAADAKRTEAAEKLADKPDDPVAKQESEDARKSVEKIEREAIRKLTAEAKGSVELTATGSGGITPGQQKPEIAETLATMQRKYVENINTDALDVACISALDNTRVAPELIAAVVANTRAVQTYASTPTSDAARGSLRSDIVRQLGDEDGRVSAFAAFCLLDILPDSIRAKKSVLETILNRSYTEKEIEAIEKRRRESFLKMVAELKRYIEEVKGLAPPAAPATK
jgi:hypothetical protein